MEQAGNDSETHIYNHQKHGFIHISKGGQKMFEDVLTKTDAFLTRLGYLQGKENVKEWKLELFGPDGKGDPADAKKKEENKS